ncbi:MAG TPA: glycosyltransferase family 39 protein [Anaerolineae bacterium]
MPRVLNWLGRHKSLLALAVITAVVFVTYFPALKLGFYGDDWIFYDLAGRLPLADYLTKYFDPRAQTAWYRPVQGVLFRTEYTLFGPNPLGYHLLNIVVHLANCFLIFGLLNRATEKRRAGFIAALVFATLPTAVLSVLWPGVIDALETLFYLTSVWFWLNYLAGNRVRDYGLAFAAFLLALFTKEIGVTLPVTLFFLDRAVVQTPARFGDLLRRYTPFLVVWLGYLPIEYVVTRRSVFVNQLGYAPDLARLAFNLVNYLATLTFPWISFPPVTFAWLGVVALVLGYAILSKRGLGLLPVVAGAILGVLPVALFPFVANRFLYLSLTGSAILFALGFDWLLARAAVFRIPLFAVLAAVAAIGSVNISVATADFGEYARVSRVTFRNVSQAHAGFPEDTLLFFVDPPVPGTNLSGMFLWRYGPGVSVLATDSGHVAGLREHAAAYVIYFDDAGNQKEQQVGSPVRARSTPLLPAGFAKGIRLEGFELVSDTVQRGQPVLLFLYWRGLKRMDADYLVSVRILDANNNVIASYAKPPHHGDAPTSGWTPGDLVVDVVQIPIPASTPAGSYRLEVGLYDPGTMGRLTIDEAGMDKIYIDPLSISE